MCRANFEYDSMYTCAVLASQYVRKVSLQVLLAVINLPYKVHTGMLQNSCHCCLIEPQIQSCYANTC